MNKRGTNEVFNELITIIIAVILFFMLVKIFWNVFTPDEELSQTEKDVKRIVDEIRDLKDKDSIFVPVMTPGHRLVIDKKVKMGAYSGCFRDYCACLVKDDTAVACQTFNIRNDFVGDFDCGEKNRGVNFATKDGEVTTDTPITLIREACKVTLSN